MEDRLSDLERRMGEWEETRKRAQRRGNFWFSVLTLIVIASPFMVTPPDEEAQPKRTQARVVGLPQLRLGRLWRAVYRPRRRSQPGSTHSTR